MTKSPCQGKTQTGQPCSRYAQVGSQYCWQHQPNQAETWRELYQRLENATPAERTDIVLGLIEEHPQGRLDLPIRERVRVNLTGIDLSRDTLKARCVQLQNGSPAWWDDKRQRAYLVGANLQEAILQEANLQEANLWRANLQRADLVGANLQEAILVEADLQKANLHGANLQEAKLSGADLQKANLQEGNLQEAKLSGADLQKANLHRANFQEADLMWADLQEADLEYANLRGAVLVWTNLQKANLQEVNLQKADLSEANLQGAYLREANLQEAILVNASLQRTDLLACISLAHIYLENAWLDFTRLRQDQIDKDKYIGEELAAEDKQLTAQERAAKYAAAKYAYLALKQNFDDLGDYDASSWAYIKERDMEMMEAWMTFRVALNERDFGKVISKGAKVFMDLLIRSVSYYGEGFERVIGWILAFIFVIGPALFWIIGRFEWTDSSRDYYFSRSYRWQQHGYTYYQLLLYTIDTFTTANFAELKPTNAAARLISGGLAMLGIFLVGLLGFVAGNRIRRS